VAAIREGRRILVLDGALIAMIALATGLAGLAWWQGGGEQLRGGLARGVTMLGRFGLLIVVSFLAAGLVETLVPREWIRGQLGAEAGLRGIALAAGAGVLTPSGPFVAIPIAVSLLRAGAGTPALVTYVSAWGLLALHRLIAWEIPMLGIRFALSRWLLCCLFPIVAGFLARALTRLGAP